MATALDSNAAPAQIPGQPARQTGPAVNVVSVDTVTAGYGSHIVFSDLSLNIECGEFAGVVGPTGCGKTTLLKIILGVQRAISGTVFLNGQAIDSTTPRRVGYVPQLETIDWTFPVTVEEVILMGLYTGKRRLPWASRQERERVHALAHRLGIYPCLKKHILNISGGQRQRAFLARALANDPELLVLDEPTSGVDIKTQHEVLHLLGDMNSQGMTILLTTHDLNLVASHLPWIICLNNGVVAQGHPHDVFTPDILKKTYGGDIVVVMHEGQLLVANASPPHPFLESGHRHLTRLKSV